MDTGKVLALDVAERDFDIQRALTEVISLFLYINFFQKIINLLHTIVVFR
jgi:hypothetical protein